MTAEVTYWLTVTWILGGIFLFGWIADSFSTWLRMRRIERSIKRLEDVLMRRT